MACLDHYRAIYQRDCVDIIFETITNERKQLKRRSDKLIGNPRDRTREIDSRRNKSVRSKERSHLKSKVELPMCPCAVCCEYFLSGVENIFDHYLTEELVNTHDHVDSLKFKGALWICSNCRKIKSNLLSGESVIEALKNIHRMQDMDCIKKTVGFVQYNTTESTYIPLIKLSTDSEGHLFGEDTQFENDSKAMVIFKMAEIMNRNDVIHERAVYIANKGSVHPLIALDTFYRDVCCRMLGAKRRMEMNLSNQRMGFLVEQILHIGEVDDNLSNEYYLREFKGTEAYKSMLETDHILRRQQNGKNCIAVKNLIFTGKISEPSLARVLLINEDIPVQVYDQDDVLFVMVPFHDEDGIAICDSRTCTEEHQSALELALEIFPGGIIPMHK